MVKVIVLIILLFVSGTPCAQTWVDEAKKVLNNAKDDNERLNNHLLRRWVDTQRA